MPNNDAPKPTIEVRLEAVVQTLELVAAIQRDHEKAIEATAKALEATSQKWDQRFDKLMSAVESLTSLAERHERRLAHLEGQ